mmetsp:Transcript_16459/g.44605  ORF Transcript_16459/g.44605 Transcript_16459/m.44605 type:complete len:246 (-) Transcript_16459:10-747(-)
MITVARRSRAMRLADRSRDSMAVRRTGTGLQARAAREMAGRTAVLRSALRRTRGSGTRLRKDMRLTGGVGATTGLGSDMVQTTVPSTVEPPPEAMARRQELASTRRGHLGSFRNRQRRESKLLRQSPKRKNLLWWHVLRRARAGDGEVKIRLKYRRRSTADATGGKNGPKQNGMNGTKRLRAMTQVARTQAGARGRQAGPREFGDDDSGMKTVTMRLVVIHRIPLTTGILMCLQREEPVHAGRVL